jgi:uncharacterized phage-associated protein
MLALMGKTSITKRVTTKGIMSRSSTKKLKELILYISEKSSSDTKFGSTKLNKLIFFSDMLYYGNTGKSITGSKYMKWDHGPVATCMKPVLDEMKAANELFTRPVNTIVGVKKVPTAMRVPDLSIFTGEEIASVDEVISDFKQATNTGLSQFSHEFIPNWDKLPMGQSIPISAIIYPTELELNEDDSKFFKNLLTDTEWGRQLQHERGGRTA